MRLFTSSFRTANIPMVALIISVVMIVAYHLLIVCLAVKPGIADTPFKLNVLVVEDYEFKDGPVETVALGSSILNRIVTQGVVDTGCENLCIKGFSALDGAAIVQHTQKYPRVAVIELSFMLLKSESYDFLAEVPDYKRWFTRYSPIVRTEYQPSSILLRLLKEDKHGTAGSTIRTRRDQSTPSSDNKGTAHATTEVKTLARSAAVINTNPGVKQFQPDRPKKMSESTRRKFFTNLKKLQACVRDLENHRTKVCFVHVPLSSTLDNSERELEQRKLYEQYFPRNLYTWIEWSGAPKEWQSGDGIHLWDHDAALFAEDMRKQIARVAQK